ncbi:MAG: 6-phosphogluconolactonase [Acidimicrobiia bacterium]|nr:6-phosphogluconolactonase [Acidimicrobiia bacterium]
MTTDLVTEIVSDAGALARAGARRIAALLCDALANRDRASLAVSGGTTPAAMLRELGAHNVPWNRVHVFQADERAAPQDDPDRNFTLLRETLLDRAPIPAHHVHPMPVERSSLEQAATDYELVLQEVTDGILDVVHLGLGDDGHTASLVTDDPVLAVDDRLVAVTRPYGGYRRLTLTFPALSSARNVVWLVSGAGKADSVRRLTAGDTSIPAGRVPRDRAVLICDAAAWVPEHP